MEDCFTPFDVGLTPIVITISCSGYNSFGSLHYYQISTHLWRIPVDLSGLKNYVSLILVPDDDNYQFHLLVLKRFSEELIIYFSSLFCSASLTTI